MNCSNFAYRKDNRSTEQFRKEIEITSQQEDLAAIVLSKYLDLNGFKHTYERFGTKEEGSKINFGKVSADADFCFKEVGGKKNMLVEIKVHPETFPCVTFKENSLIKHMKERSMLLVFRETHFLGFPFKGQEWIVQNVPRKVYSGFAPGKPAYRLYSDHMDFMADNGLMFKKFWPEPCLREISKYPDLFSRSYK